MSNKTFKKAIEIECSSNAETTTVRDAIHNQLVGNEDYINDNIVLNTEGDKVIIVIFNECKNEPNILI